MGNSLDRNIAEGEVVILDKRYIDPEYWDDRRVEVQGGFGMSKNTTGTALSVKWLSDGETGRWEGFMINPIETEIYQKDGRFGRDIIPDPVPCPRCRSLDSHDIDTLPVTHYCNPCGYEWKDEVE